MWPREGEPGVDTCAAAACWRWASLPSYFAAFLSPDAHPPRQVEHEFHSYVRPTFNQTLTPFCVKLTGITQETVDVAPTLDKVLLIFVASQNGPATKLHTYSNSYVRSVDAAPTLDTVR